MLYLSHSKGANGHPKLLPHHLREVASLTRTYASVFGAGAQGWLAGLLHDLGKYGELFQRRLAGQESGIDHWTAGSAACQPHLNCHALASALAILGHHIGLQKADADWLRHSLGKSPNPSHLRFSHGPAGWESLLPLWQNDFGDLPIPHEGVGTVATSRCAWMLDIRMLFSALADADYLCTEAHFDGPGLGRDAGPVLDPAALTRAVDEEIVALRAPSAERIQQLRRDILADCRRAADLPPGLFTLTAPTGAGKTLSALRFAAGHAQAHGHRRIVYVSPYLSIFDQTARVWRRVIERLGLDAPTTDRYLLEHASLTRLDFEADAKRPDAPDAETRRTLQSRFSENWDAPLVLTTNVQFFESLFANRPSKCRKLHRLARTTILCDEIQTLPPNLACATLATLKRLSEPPFHASVVFMTATQPAFSSLNTTLKKHWGGVTWEPREIIQQVDQRFAAARRYQTRWPATAEASTWDDVSHWLQQLEGTRQALVIVNLKRHARALMDKVQGWTEPLHLSTSMCPAHRQAVLAEVTRRLHAQEPIILISTQCVEAGVDLDFPYVFRAVGPLDSLAQAAGRCNRHGKFETGYFRVFEPEDQGLPADPSYQAATERTRTMLRHRGQLDLDQPATFETYFRGLYDVTGLGTVPTDLKQAIDSYDFPTVAREYRLIEQNTVQVVVPYHPEAFQDLDRSWLEDGLTAEWIRRARPYTVNEFRGDRVAQFCQPICIHHRGQEIPTGWWILGNPAHYQPDLGLQFPNSGGLDNHVD